MKNIILAFFAVFISSLVFAQSNTDKEFNKQLDIYLRLNKELKFDEMMDYTHPRIFQLASKEQLTEALKTAFDNPNFSMSLDSIFITDISAPFIFENSNYRKIEYRMLAGIKFKDTGFVSGKEDIDMMIKSLESGFQGGTVTYDESTRWFRINTKTIMFGIKDTTKPWLFLGYQENSPELKKIYPPEVIAHFQL
jgi:hypothetical protein